MCELGLCEIVSVSNLPSLLFCLQLQGHHNIKMAFLSFCLNGVVEETHLKMEVHNLSK